MEPHKPWRQALFLPLFRNDIETESFINGVRNAFDACLEDKRVVGDDFWRGLIVGDHAEDSAILLIVTIVLVPRRSQGLLLHEEQITRSGEHLIESARIDGLLKI